MILFIRHGQTDCNVKKIIQGQLDAPLNQKGLEQAELTAQKLKDFKIDEIYASPLSRARQTAEVVNKFHRVPIICDDRLKEQNAGDATGMSEHDVTKEMYEDFMCDPHKYHAESPADLYQRNADFARTLNDQNKTILIVAHRGNFSMLTRYFQNLSLDDKTDKIENCEIKILKN